jgi:hypothetical protein
MKQTITFQLQAISVNSMYYGNRLHGKTTAAREWSNDVLNTLKRYSVELTALRELFNEQKHVYKMHLEMLVPIDVMYTKTGIMTSKIPDLTNIEKPLIDLVMLPKHFAEAGNLNKDDRFLQSILSEKIPTKNEWGLVLHIEIVDKPKI